MTMEQPPGYFKPTRQQIEGAQNSGIEDVLGKGIKLLLCGINPGLYTAAIGKHFGRPGNRFWPTLFHAGFTPRLFSPFEQHLLLELGIGITNFVNRATARADEVTDEELAEGGNILRKKVLKYKPHTVAVLGLTSFRDAFKQPKAKLGLQEMKIGTSHVWVLPNPSGLNAHFQIPQLAELFAQLKAFLPE